MATKDHLLIMAARKKDGLVFFREIKIPTMASSATALFKNLDQKLDGALAWFGSHAECGCAEGSVVEH